MITLLTVGLRPGIEPFLGPVAEDLDLSRTTSATIVALGMPVYGTIGPNLEHLFEPVVSSPHAAARFTARPR